MTNSGNKSEIAKKKVLDGFAIALLFFSSTYCKLECVVRILFLAYVVESQQEVTSMEIIKVGKFYKDTLVKNKTVHFTSLWFAEDRQVPKVYLSLFLWPADSASWYQLSPLCFAAKLPHLPRNVHLNS